MLAEPRQGSVAGKSLREIDKKNREIEGVKEEGPPEETLQQKATWAKQWPVKIGG